MYSVQHVNADDQDSSTVVNILTPFCDDDETPAVPVQSVGAGGGGTSGVGTGGGARFPRSDGVKLFNEFSHYLMNDAWCVARPKIRMEPEGYQQYQEQGGRIVKNMYADLESLAQNTAGAGAEIRVPTLDGNDKDRWLGKERKSGGGGKEEKKEEGWPSTRLEECSRGQRRLGRH